jgi:hypothetical protein
VAGLAAVLAVHAAGEVHHGTPAPLRNHEGTVGMTEATTRRPSTARTHSDGAGALVLDVYRRQVTADRCLLKRR